MSEPGLTNTEADKQPIISKWHSGEQIEDAQIGSEGHIAEVRRRVFDTPEGKKSYAVKLLDSAQEAARIFKIYSTFKTAGLPVVGFMKSIHRKEDSKDIVECAMEDATEGDKYSLQAVYYQVGSKSYPILSRANNAPQLRDQMVDALAVIHNLGIYHFHSRTSFFLRVDQANPSNVDFIILDYSNFAEETNPRSYRREIRPFAQECNDNLMELLNGLTPEAKEREQLEERYRNLVQNKVKHFNLEIKTA